MAARIVIDTNVFVSALRSRRGASYRLFSLLGRADFEISLSVPLVLEYEAVAKRMAGDTGLSHDDVDDILDYLCKVARLHQIHFLWRPLLKDAKDDQVLELAVEAGCEVIVTHNLRDFAGSEAFGIAAMTPGEFLRARGEIP